MQGPRQQEFAALINANQGIIYKVIRLYVRNIDDEQDLYQEILFQAWKSWERFKGDSKFSTWLYRVALNTVLTFRRRAKLVMPVEDISVYDTPVPAPDHDAEVLYKSIRELGEVERMIISLHLDGYENDEIGEITGLTKNHVAVKLHRTKETLIRKLRE